MKKQLLLMFLTMFINLTAFGQITTVSLIGSATSDGWNTNIDMIQDANDTNIWTLNITLAQGELKFIANHSLDVAWGAGSLNSFPTGIAVPKGQNFVVPAGKYRITFNSLTGKYSFEELVVYDQISIVGKNGPFGRWPDDTGDYDTYLTKDANNDQLWTGTNIDLTEADTTTEDSGIKFRANTDWAVNWGAKEFSGGTSVRFGPNIWCKAGTWNVTFNSATGEYKFVKSSATINLYDNKVVTVYPNPTKENLNIDITKLKATGDILINVYKMSGKLIMSKRMSAAGIIKLDATGLNTGTYFISVSNHAFMIGKKFNVVKKT